MTYQAGQECLVDLADDSSDQVSDAGWPTAPSTQNLPSASPQIVSALSDNYQDFKRFLMRRVGDVATAEDILQSFCVRVLKQNIALRNNRSALAWLYTVLKSVLTDHYRRESTRQRNEAGYAEQCMNLGENIVEQETPSNYCACVSPLLDDLRRDYAQILYRADICEAPRAALGRELNISPDNLRVRLHRARKAMFEALKSRCGSCCDTQFDDCFCGKSSTTASSSRGGEDGSLAAVDVHRNPDRVATREIKVVKL